MKIIFTIFESLNRSETIIEELIVEGVNPDQISIITTDTYDDNFDATLNREVEGVASGVLAGLLAEVVSIKIENLGEVFLVGPAAVLLDMNTDSGTLAEAFINAGIDDENAEAYEEYVRRDYVLIGVSVDKKSEKDVSKVFDENGGLYTSSLDLSI